MTPRCAFVLVERDTVSSYLSDAEIPKTVGGKASGLLSIPPAWTPKFVAVSPGLLDEYLTADPGQRRSVVDSWCEKVEAALEQAGIPQDASVIIRSNAVRETLEDRGTYTSQSSSRDDLSQTVTDVLDALVPFANAGRQIGLIVQEFKEPIRYGHLSNERRVAEEYRDAEMLTVDPRNGQEIQQRLVHRNWRRGPADEAELACASESEIKTALREPLAYAAQRSIRLHYEWVWDGSVVWVVQADQAPDRVAGESPLEVVGSPPALADLLELTYFRVATREDGARSTKLRSHLNYRAEGYWQPRFFILDDAELIADVLRGDGSEHLASDLALLVAHPLMIRTSGPPDAQLLPRSPLLTDVGDAVTWLQGDFASEINRRGLAASDVTLLAHHYIPAVAAAFCCASPGQRHVLVQALWGMPEGMGYYPYDEYHVVTPPTSSESPGYEGFVAKARRQHKPYFVAPDEHGRFCRHVVARPWDWKSTVPTEDVLFRMARFTRTVAEEEGESVNIMWFLGCRTTEGDQDAIPWFQARQEAADGNTEFRRNARDERVTVSTEADLKGLERRPLPKAAETVGRLVVELSPSEDIALRDEAFARRVGMAAMRQNAVVILNGARLAHIYYVLAKTGAEVVSRPIGEELDVHEDHNKLVRDRIPEKVAEGGEMVRVASLTPAERLLALKVKLVEEALEVRDATAAELIEELADVQEVVQALIASADLVPEEVEDVRARKAGKRGGFVEGRMLLQTGDPEAVQSVPLLDDSPDDANGLLRVSKPKPLEKVHQGGSEVRRQPGFTELVRDVTVTLSTPEWKVAIGPVPIGGAEGVLSGLIEAQRRGAELKLRIRVRVGDEQVSLPLESDEGVDGDVGEPS